MLRGPTLYPERPMRSTRDQGKSWMEEKTGAVSVTKWHLRMFKKEASRGRSRMS